MQWAAVAARVGRQSEAVTLQAVVDAVQGAKAIQSSANATGGIDIRV